jgi:hypothetical protein
MPTYTPEQTAKIEEVLTDPNVGQKTYEVLKYITEHEPMKAIDLAKAIYGDKFTTTKSQNIFSIFKTIEKWGIPCGTNSDLLVYLFEAPGGYRVRKMGRPRKDRTQSPEQQKTHNPNSKDILENRINALRNVLTLKIQQDPKFAISTITILDNLILDILQ